MCVCACEHACLRVSFFSTGLAGHKVLCMCVLANIDAALSLPPKCFGNTRGSAVMPVQLISIELH